MKKYFIKNLFLLFILLPQLSVYCYGQSVTDQLTFTSKKIKNGKYVVDIIVPPGYDPAKAYPVCYFLDMQLAEELMKQINDSLQQEKSIRPYIFVGIKCQENDRWCTLQRTRDFTPSYSSAMDATLNLTDPEDEISGGAPAFLSFLETEIIPTVEKKYKGIAKQRTLYGMSLSGLFACYVMLQRPHLFYQYIIGAPSLWYNGAETLERLKEVKPGKIKHLCLYLGIGDLDSPVMYVNFEQFTELLQKKRVPCTSEVYPGKNHTGIWRIHLTNGISTLFHNP
ncbi:MAG TPA: alpha/beta hydrolase-fold protein [Cytophagaceae bacterium]|nr:alpha/beta hydrolase-fold protein [Cytophagaceae bacterium]